LGSARFIRAAHGSAQTLPPAGGRKQIPANDSSAQPLRTNLPITLSPAINPPPPDMARHALEIFNGVSPEARSWILDQARTRAGHSPFNAEAIGSAANQRFGAKKQLSPTQQDALTLAVLYQVMKLDDEEYRRKTDRSLIVPTTPAAGPSSPNKVLPKPGTSLANAGGNAASLQASDKMGNFEMQRLMSEFNQAQTLAAQIDKKHADASASVIGKM
jgi:hypothetical protein